MKVFISADMEGATGVAVGAHVGSDSSDYGRMRKLLTADINAAIRGAMAGGATDFVVTDAHGKMTNILIEDLDRHARLFSGSNKPFAQMEGIGPEYAAAFFVAYHAREGTEDGLLNHTLLGNTVYEIRCNGRPFGETGINAALAGHFGVPVCLVTGDDKVAGEARELLGDIEAAQVKTSSERLVANLLPPAASSELIAARAQAAVERAGRGEIKPFQVPGPVQFEIDFKSTAGVKMACLFPTVEYLGSKSLRVRGDDYLAAFRQMWGTLIMVRACQSGAI
ncbi:MAG: M55 family metallopeptidase [Bacillota bacterium]|nr:M55 family metallopeptidase [Bacillota bacterium]